ncbi:ATP synthase F0, B subunit [Isosphaera pallida ATCC 43644]|jgi:F-type H+-transporting ATPase subunit b|uniref:ATP synthase subunit b n=1 Tax=Isosphaera pallida (strain ATCC 43644 / DSM 9630 / IS1B) TaxID=575540 RepID=E8R030_ISOPI|nr:F0F1 ATP synthase subunit B [Isosphaera pallida]ADV61148.1 ATP synthase F0, B subunit [Isosphaera pallida ATCC 43644]
MRSIRRWTGALAALIASLAAPATVLATESAEPPPTALGLELNLVAYSLIVFLILLAILWKYAWTPIVQALDAREASLNQIRQEAEAARSETLRLQTEYETKLAAAAEEVKALIEEARRDAQATKAEILRAANEEAAAIKARAEQAIKLAKDEALKELWDRATELSVVVAGRLLPRELSHDDQRRLTEQAIHELEMLKTSSGVSSETAA